MSKLRGVSYVFSCSRHIRSTQLCRSVSNFPHHRPIVTFSPQLQNLIPLVPDSLCGIRSFSYNAASIPLALQAQVEREKQREREERIRMGLDTADIDAEDDEDYLGVGPLIDKLEKWKIKTPPNPELDMMREEPTDSESDEDERFSPEAIQKRSDDFEKKFERHKELLKNFTDSKTLDESFKWMNRLNKFEQKHFKLRPEYIVIGELMNRLKEATGKDKFLLQHKLNRAMRLVDWKEAYDPNNPANYGVFQHEDEAAVENEELEKEQLSRRAQLDDDDDMEFDSMKERDDILLEKLEAIDRELEAIDRELEQKLANLNHTFGKKGKVLEEEIRDLAEERNSLTEQKRRPLYRKMTSILRTHRKIWRFCTAPAMKYGGFMRMYSDKPKRKVDLKKLRPMIMQRISNRAKDYPIKAMIPVAEDVLKARVLLIQGVSTLLHFVPLWACKFCPEVYIGEKGHLIKTCGGYRHRAKNQQHEWVKGSLNDIIVPVKTFHLKNMFQNVIEHQERFDFDRVPAVVELCLQAGAFQYDESSYSSHLNFDTNVNSFVGDASLSVEDQRFVARGTLSAWEIVKSGVQKLLLTYPTKVCEHCSELHVGPSGHRARLCGVFKYQRWRGTHFWKKAEVDDLVPPKVVWFRRPQDPPLLLNTCREFYGHVPAVVDLCVKAGAIPPSKYLCMMKMQGLSAPLSAPAVVED